METEWRRGNHYGAVSASRAAKNWGIAGIITGVFVTIGITVLFVVANLTANSNEAADNQ